MQPKVKAYVKYDPPYWRPVYDFQWEDIFGRKSGGRKT